MGGGRRKGELSKSAIDHGWPFQVAVHESVIAGRNYVTVHLWIDGEGLSLCRLGHAFYRDGSYHNVLCFAEREHAERFHAKFGGEMMTPETRPRWPNKPPRGRRK